MLSVDSPFLNIPVALDPKQAVFLDGMRHAAQIIQLSYTRLCRALTGLAVGDTNTARSSKFAHVFLDTWGFIDAADRFRGLWEMYPSAETIPGKSLPDALRFHLQDIRNIRNVSAHIAQKVDQIVSLNSSVLGSIRWISVVSNTSPKFKTCFIRPGILRGHVKDQFAKPNGEINFLHGCGCISVRAGKHEAELSLAYKSLCSTVASAEERLRFAFRHSSLEERFPADMIGIAELDTGTKWR